MKMDGNKVKHVYLATRVGKNVLQLNTGLLLSAVIFIILTCEYSRFSLLLAAKDVSPEGTCAPQRQKFHADDVKTVRILVRSSDWSTK